MMRRTTSLLLTFILLCFGGGCTLYGQNKITLTTKKTVGEQIKLQIKSVPGASLSYEGLEEDASGNYTVGSSTFSIVGDVEELRFTNCGITAASFSPQHSTLKAVWGNFNQMVGTIDLSGAPKLETFVVSKNLLSNVNLANCPKLSLIYADRNSLETINIEGCNALTFLSVSTNCLGSLLFPSEASGLKEIRCENNQIYGEAMRATLRSLPDLSASSEWTSILLVNQRNKDEKNWAWHSDIVLAKEQRGYLCNGISEEGEIGDYEGIEDPQVITQQVSMTIGSDIVGQSKFITIKGVGEISIDGVEEAYDPNRNSYTFTKQEVTIRGEVTDLTCSILGLTKLDVSQATSLARLDCSSNALTELDLSNNIKLEKLICLNNKIAQLSLDNHAELTEFNSSNNELTQLSIKNSPKLSRCDVYLNNLSTEALNTFVDGLRSCEEDSHGILVVIDTKNNKIRERNKLTNEIITSVRSKNWDVYDWAAGNAIQITDVAISDALITLETGLAIGEKIALEISGSDNVAITGVAEPFEAYYKEYTLTDTKLTIQGDVKVLVCSRQKIQKIDVSQCPVLEYLHAYRNELSTFTISNHSNIKRLLLSENALTEVNVSNCENLETISLWGNKLQGIGLSNCPKITYVDCMRNNIGDEAFQKFVEALPTIPGAAEAGVFMAVDTQCNPSDKNVLNKSTVDKAIAKHWLVKDFCGGKFGEEGAPFEGSDVAVDKVAESNLAIYPNPATDWLYITGAAPGASVSLHALDGQLLYQSTTSAVGATSIELVALAPGCYILQVGSDKKQIIKQ